MSGVSSCCRKRAVQVKKRNLCRACDLRWQRAGRPDAGPPPPSKGGRPRDGSTDDRAAETRRLLAGGSTLTELAERYGVTHQTVMYYRDRPRCDEPS
ncbi:helix-turn-helix domain-containing protein [Nonomuraea angiospora]|uniref:helix-turn-helix domain-containing protein n=1 Tax=Nonomuraea angiospora TaxID=46172 RepID=UPI0033DD3ECC